MSLLIVFSQFHQRVRDKSVTIRQEIFQKLRQPPSPHLATASKSHGRFKGPINRSMLLDFKDDAILIYCAMLLQTRNTAQISANGNFIPECDIESACLSNHH